MTDVVPIRADVRLPDEPCPAVVELLETQLERARRGEVIGVALAVTRPDGGVGTAWDGAAGTRNALVTGIVVLAHRIGEAITKDE